MTKEKKTKKTASQTLEGLAFEPLFCLGMHELYVYCTSVRLFWDSQPHHVAFPPKASQSSAGLWRIMQTFHPLMPQGAVLRLALCKQETCAHSALSVATVMLVTLSSLYRKQDGHLNQSRKKIPTTSWPYLSIYIKSMKALLWLGSLNVHNKRQASIHLCFMFSFVCTVWLRGKDRRCFRNLTVFF